MRMSDKQDSFFFKRLCTQDSPLLIMKICRELHHRAKVARPESLISITLYVTRVPLHV